MIILGIVLFVLAFFIHDIAKALADARLFDTGNTPLHQWAVKKPERFVWYTGGEPYKDKQGFPWSCDFWHLWDGHVRIWTVCLGGISGGVAGFYGFNPLWFIPIGWVAYWIAGNIFKYLFHVKFMGDWTVQKFWSEVF